MGTEPTPIETLEAQLADCAERMATARDQGLCASYVLTVKRADALLDAMLLMGHNDD